LIHGEKEAKKPRFKESWVSGLGRVGVGDEQSRLLGFSVSGLLDFLPPRVRVDHEQSRNILKLSEFLGLAIPQVFAQDQVIPAFFNRTLS
jgi:hypothetical protein